MTLAKALEQTWQRFTPQIRNSGPISGAAANKRVVTQIAINRGSNYDVLFG